MKFKDAAAGQCLSGQVQTTTVFNTRGVHFRQVFEGGDQERDLARSYANDAKIAEAWPRTSALTPRGRAGRLCVWNTGGAEVASTVKHGLPNGRRTSEDSCRFMSATGWKAAVRSSRLNDASAPRADLGSGRNQTFTRTIVADHLPAAQIRPPGWTRLG